MIDQATALQLRDLLLKAAKLVETSINKESGTSCVHDDYIELTRMGAKTRSYLCSSCGHTWNEDYPKEVIDEFKTFVG